MSTISENTVAESAVGDNSVNQGQYIFDFEVVGLDLSATDNQSEGSTRQDDDATVYDHFRPALRAVKDNTVSLTNVAQDAVQQIFDVNDTASFTYGDFDVAYEYNGLILEFQDDYPGLPIGPITVNTIGDIQYIGPQNFIPGLVELSIGATDDTIKSTSRITLGALDIGVVDNDDGSSFIRPADGATVYPQFRPALRMVVDDTATMSLGTLGGDSTAYLFASAGIDRLERYAGLPILPISVNAIGTVQYEGTMDYQPSIGNLEIAVASTEVKSVQRITTGVLEIGATDNQGSGTVRVEDGKIEYPHFRPSLEVDRSYVTELTFGALGGNDTAYFFKAVGIDRLPNYAGIPISPISFNPIGTVQYEGVMDYQPSGGSLTLDVDDTIANISVIVDTLTLEIGVDWNDGVGVVRDSDGKTEYPYFRPSLEAEIDSVPFKTLAATSVEYKFVYDINYQLETGSGIPIGPISVNSISEEQQVPGSLQPIYVYGDTLALEIAATSSLGGQTERYDIDTTVDLEVEASDVITNQFVSDDTVGIEVETTDTIEQLFVFDDTGIFGIATATGIVSVSANVEVTPLIVNAISIAERTINVPETIAELEISGDNSRENFVTNVGTTTGELEISATDEVDVIYVPKQPDNPSQVFTVDSAYRNANASTAEYILLLDNVKQDAIDSFVADFNNKTGSTGYDLPLVETYITFWKQGNIQHAIRQTATNTNTNYYDYNKPRALASTLSSKQAIVIDTNPNALNIIGATFDNVSYNLTTSFEFDEVRYYQGDPYDNNELLLWSSSLSSILVAEDADAFEVAKVYDDTLELEIAGDTEVVQLFTFISTTEVEIEASDTFSRTFAYDDTAQFIKLASADEDIIYDIEDTTDLEIEVNDTVSKSVSRITEGAIEIDASFTLGITEASTGELELSDDATFVQIFEFDDTTSLGVLGATDTDIIYHFETVEFISIAATDDVEIIYTSDEDAELELSDEATFVQIFDFDDAAAFKVLVAVDEEVSYYIENVEFVSLAASDDVVVIYNSNEDAETVIGDAATTSSTRNFDNTVSLKKLGATSTELSVNIDHLAELEIEATDVIGFRISFIDDAELELADADITSVIINIDSTASLSIEGDSISVKAYAEVNEVELNVGTIVAGSSTRTFVPQVELDLGDNDTFENIFAYNDRAEFIKLGATDIEFTADFDDTIELEIDTDDAVVVSSNFVPQVEISIGGTDEVVYSRTFVEDVELEIRVDETTQTSFVYVDETGLVIYGVGIVPSDIGAAKQYWSNSSSISSAGRKQIWID